MKRVKDNKQTSTVTPSQTTWETFPMEFRSHPCPACGYCPHCGRGGYNTQPWQPFQPIWYNSQPTVTCGGQTQGPNGGFVGDVVSTFM